MRTVRNISRIAVLAMLAAVLAACNSGTDTPSPSGSGGGNNGAAGLANAKSLVEAGLKTSATFPAPTGTVTAGTHQIAVIAAGLATIGASATAQFVQEAVKAIGWTAPPTYDGKFAATTQSGLIQQAVNGGAQALVLVAITPSTVASAVNVALSKNLPIVCVLCGPDPSEGVNGTIINVEPSPQKTGQLQGAYVVAKSEGKAKALVYRSDQYPFTKLQIDAALAEIAADCPACTTNVQSMKSGDQLQPGIPILASQLTQNPKGTLTHIIAPYDSAAQPFAQLTHQLGRDEIGVVGYSATPNFATLIGAGNPPGAVADITIPLPYMGWSAVDLLARALSNAPTWDASQMPVGLLTKDNFSQYPADSQYLSPAGDFRATFKTSWGKQG